MKPAGEMFLDNFRSIDGVIILAYGCFADGAESTIDLEPWKKVAPIYCGSQGGGTKPEHCSWTLPMAERKNSCWPGLYGTDIGKCQAGGQRSGAHSLNIKTPLRISLRCGYVDYVSDALSKMLSRFPKMKRTRLQLHCGETPSAGECTLFPPCREREDSTVMRALRRCSYTPQEVSAPHETVGV